MRAHTAGQPVHTATRERAPIVPLVFACVMLVGAGWLVLLTGAYYKWVKPAVSAADRSDL
jgi:hypothetical protein